MKKGYLFLADGCEEIEALTPVDILRRAGIEVKTVSISDRTEVTGSHGIGIRADALFADQDFSDADYLILPGGMPGTKHLGAHEGLCALLREAARKEIWICAICAAPSVLGDMGLLKGRKATCYPGLEPRLTGAETLQEEVVRSGNFITSRGMGTAIPFALEIVSVLGSSEQAEELGKSVVYRV